MNVLEKRQNRSEEILQGKFIRKVLEETSRDIQKAQNQRMSSFRSEFWNNRQYKVSDGQLVHMHDKRQRFVDMRTRADNKGNKNKKKSYVVHNRIIWGQYNNLTRDLAYGYTDAVKDELRKLEE
ncbi:hypothetical protein [Flavobacterium sp.]|uniref:hypothetical protein n=1 Tax=Flavobacterium sp. TaxID=239 RepID=UPI00260B30AB|nr:hypothetical protein [Flavobacterium sp.]